MCLLPSTVGLWAWTAQARGAEDFSGPGRQGLRASGLLDLAGRASAECRGWGRNCPRPPAGCHLLSVGRAGGEVLVAKGQDATNSASDIPGKTLRVWPSQKPVRVQRCLSRKLVSAQTLHHVHVSTLVFQYPWLYAVLQCPAGPWQERLGQAVPRRSLLGLCGTVGVRSRWGALRHSNQRQGQRGNP